MVVLVPSFHTHIIIISDCYWSVNTYFNRATILLEWFHHLVLLWKYTELRSVKFKCHFRAIRSFFSKTSALFFFKQGNLISQLPIKLAKSYLLKIVSLLLMLAVACIKRRGCSLFRERKDWNLSFFAYMALPLFWSVIWNGERNTDFTRKCASCYWYQEFSIF